MGLGAIVVMGAERESFGSDAPRGAAGESLFAEPLACVDILGRSMIERTIERFADAEVEAVSVLAVAPKSFGALSFSGVYEKVKVQVVADLWSAISQEVEKYSQRGIECAFVSSANLYAEADILDLSYFHRESRRVITRAVDGEGPLDLWMIDCAKARQSDLETLLMGADGAGGSYLVGGYVNRMAKPEDLRRLVSDALCGRCAIRPVGQEIKPGIWIGEGAEVHKRARIVAPAYIGCRSRLREDTLVTRCSSIERECYVDCGTVIEDSSILANTHVGIWLDMSRVIANGNKFMSLGRDVVVGISDPNVMRANGSVLNHRWNLGLQEEGQPIVTRVQPQKLPAQESWQLGANPIQG